MGKLIAGRIFSAIIVAGGWLVAGLRLALDLIGYSTVPDDLKVAQGRVEQAIDYLFAIPWWGPLGFATVATLWLMHVSWPRTQGAVPLLPHASAALPANEKTAVADNLPVKAIALRAETQEERQAKNELGAFAMNYLLPACEAQRAFQNAILRRLCGSASVVELLARKGLAADGPNADFERHRKALASDAARGRVSMSLDEITEHVRALSILYPAYCAQSKWLCHNTNINPKEDPSTSKQNMDWRNSDSALIGRYEPFLRDSRFPSLNDLSPRPGRSFIVES